MSAKDPYYVKDVLRFCNKLRRKDGLKPLDKLPKGFRGDPRSCPCGKACHYAVYGDQAERINPATGKWEVVPVSKAVTRFVGAFDNGDLPQYEDRS